VDESWPSSYIFADRLRSQNRSWGQAFHDNGRRAVLKKAGRAVDGFLPGLTAAGPAAEFREKWRAKPGILRVEQFAKNAAPSRLGRLTTGKNFNT